MKNRRQFLSMLIRGGIFTSITLLGGVMIRRWGEAENCRQNYECSNCRLSGHCRLPEADSYRLEKARYHKSGVNDGRTGK